MISLATGVISVSGPKYRKRLRVSFTATSRRYGRKSSCSDSADRRHFDPGPARCFSVDAFASRSPHPERSGLRVLAAAGNGARRQQLLRMIVMEIVERGDDLKFAIVGEERLDQVLLVPQPLVVQHPFGDVVARGEHVMDMDQHARLEPAEYLQHFVEHIALRADDVR